ncbi:hypothetical protein [Flavihumibacter solisilvae]|uniref:MoxR-vWA-beta-propeller ternary system domain-containing protein n=1 Tax=Flavihumibacter solisilvae TaxID=1349421 RepID=A0A0C1KZB5_9BACT|nr:hypothetical protein [Flavihumibacter solisilvae]KIC92611.1 hypothetical protein OI18_21750 [Flavihumibacter solisilvae]
MKLAIAPVQNNSWPVKAFLVEAASPSTWLRDIFQAGIQLKETVVYPLPGKTANSVWGCLVVMNEGNLPNTRHPLFQLAGDVLFIPACTALRPILISTDYQQLFRGARHLMHPELGLIELPAPIIWEEIVGLPAVEQVESVVPAETVFIPGDIKIFIVEERSPDDLIEQMNKELFPAPLTAGPLNFFEKIKLYLLRLLLGGKPDAAAPRSRFRNFMAKLFSQSGLEKPMQKLAANLEMLEERNKKEVDKLLELFRDNPAEALKYAIPIDSRGASRGSQPGAFELSRRWMNFSLFSGTGSGSGATVYLANNEMARLQEQYHKAANDLIERQQYEKAAFIYLKLLANPHRAAEVLETGKFYAEAAALYHKNNQLEKAAECYTKADMTRRAIDLYKQLNNPEKVGDLHASLKEYEDARNYYLQAATRQQEQYQYLDASRIYRHKLEDHEMAQATLLRGWNEGKEAVTCLGRYFSHIGDEKERIKEIKLFYSTNIHKRNSEKFLQVLKIDYDALVDISVEVRPILFEIISSLAPENPHILSELKLLIPDDNKLQKDIVLYRHQLLQEKKNKPIGL